MAKGAATMKVHARWRSGAEYLRSLAICGRYAQQTQLRDYTLSELQDGITCRLCRRALNWPADMDGGR